MRKKIDAILEGLNEAKEGKVDYIPKEVVGKFKLEDYLDKKGSTYDGVYINSKTPNDIAYVYDLSDVEILKSFLGKLFKTKVSVDKEFTENKNILKAALSGDVEGVIKLMSDKEEQLLFDFKGNSLNIISYIGGKYRIDLHNNAITQLEGKTKDGKFYKDYSSGLKSLESSAKELDKLL